MAGECLLPGACSRARLLLCFCIRTCTKKMQSNKLLAPLGAPRASGSSHRNRRSPQPPHAALRWCADGVLGACLGQLGLWTNRPNPSLLRMSRPRARLQWWLQTSTTHRPSVVDRKWCEPQWGIGDWTKRNIFVIARLAAPSGKATELGSWPVLGVRRSRRTLDPGNAPPQTLTGPWHA